MLQQLGGTFIERFLPHPPPPARPHCSSRAGTQYRTSASAIEVSDRHHELDLLTSVTKLRPVTLFCWSIRAQFWRERVGIEPTSRLATTSAILKTVRATRPVRSHSSGKPYFTALCAHPVRRRLSQSSARSQSGHTSRLGPGRKPRDANAPRPPARRCRAPQRPAFGGDRCMHVQAKSRRRHGVT
jgi:hypothetical protein